MILSAAGLLPVALGRPARAAPQPHDKPPEAAEPTDDRTVRLVIDAEPQHLNPLLDPDLWGYRIAHSLICEPLVQLRRSGPAAGSPSGEPAAATDSPSRYEGVLAERFHLESDGRGLDLWVRKGVRFHDGRPLTAYDVKATLEMVMRSPSSAPRTQALLGNVIRVLMIGKDGVHLDLRRPSVPGQSILAALGEIDIVPESQFPGGKLAYQGFNRRPVCTGPFRLAEWKRGSHLLLRRSPTYWGAAPAAAALRFTIANDGARGLAYLRQGTADVLLRVSPRYRTDQVEPAVQRGRWHKAELDASQVVALLWNARHPALAFAGVRRALAAHIDRQRLVSEIRAGLGTPVFGPLLDAKAAELSEPGSSPTSALTLEAAGEHLDAAGVMRLGPGVSGPRVFQGRPLSLRALVPAGSSELAEVSRRIGEGLLRAGLKWETEVVELPTFMARLRQGSFDVALCAWAWTGGDSELDLEPLLRLSLPAQHALLPELTGALHGRAGLELAAVRQGGGSLGPAAAHFLMRWEAEQPISLLYRTRQLVLASPAVRPLPLPAVTDALDLRRIYLAPGAAADLAQGMDNGPSEDMPSSLVNSLPDSLISELAGRVLHSLAAGSTKRP